MPSKKLMTLLRAFSRTELNRFEKYLQSPLFNENEKLIQLYDLIVKQFNKEQQTDATAQKRLLWEQIFQKQTYDDAQMRRLLSELTQHTLYFLTLKSLENEPLKKGFLLLQALEEINLDVHFSSALKQINVLQEYAQHRSSTFYFYQNLAQEVAYHYAERKGHDEVNFDNLKNADYYLESYYIIKKLKYYCDVLDYQNITNKKINIYLSPNFLEWLPSSKHIEEKSIKIYYLIVQMLLHPERLIFFTQVKSLLKNEGDIFESTELNSIYIYLKNYCIDKINSGKLEFFHELFDIFQVLIDKNILVKDKFLNPQDYKNIISVSIQVHEFAWTEAFIQTYTPKLPPEERENALTYNLAKVYFAQNQYEKVIEQLREVEYDNLTYALGGKLMLLKTYYELNEYLALDSLIDSFRVYLRRNQTISKEVRQQYLNVLRFIKKLSNIHPGDQVAITKIEQQIQDCKNLADKGWIVSKVEGLKG